VPHGQVLVFTLHDAQTAQDHLQQPFRFTFRQHCQYVVGPIFASQQRLRVVLPRVYYLESEVNRRGREGTLQTQRFLAEIKHHLGDVLFVDANKIAVILQHPHLEAGLVEGLKLDMMKQTVFSPNNKVGAMVEDLGCSVARNSITLPPKSNLRIMPSPSRRNSDFKETS